MERFSLAELRFQFIKAILDFPWFHRLPFKADLGLLSFCGFMAEAKHLGLVYFLLAPSGETRGGDMVFKSKR